jgi:hypothetical protein
MAAKPTHNLLIWMKVSNSALTAAAATTNSFIARASHTINTECSKKLLTVSVSLYYHGNMYY